LCMFLFSSFWLRWRLMTPARNSGRRPKCATHMVCELYMCKSCYLFMC
jgi:hypothetical protein